MLDLRQVRWRKSSRSAAGPHNCVEVAEMADMVAVRDSKDPGGPVLVFGSAMWGAFMAEARSGRYDVR